MNPKLFLPISKPLAKFVIKPPKHKIGILLAKGNTARHWSFGFNTMQGWGIQPEKDYCRVAVYYVKNYCSTER